MLVTKDADFVDSFLLRGEPAQLLLVSTGNIPNRELETLFQTHLDALLTILATHTFVELDRTGLTIREGRANA